MVDGWVSRTYMDILLRTDQLSIGSKSAFRKIMIDISPAMEGRDGESMAYLYFASYCMALASMFVSLL